MDYEVFRNVKELAQVRNNNTSANSALSSTKRQKYVVTSILVCNQTGSSATYSIYLDQNGTTYDQTTALFYAVTLAANSTALIEFIGGLPLGTRSAAGNLAVQNGTSNAITFSIYGIEIIS